MVAGGHQTIGALTAKARKINRSVALLHLDDERNEQTCIYPSLVAFGEDCSHLSVMQICYRLMP